MNLKMLAAHLGLSQTTVSRALNGYPEVSEATRQRVVEAAQRLNYAPNQRAKGLATGRAMAIGHVIPVSKQHEMMNPVFGDFVAGAFLDLQIVPSASAFGGNMPRQTRLLTVGHYSTGPTNEDEVVCHRPQSAS